MALSLFSQFFVGQIDFVSTGAAVEKSAISGMASLMAHLVSLGATKAIHICDAEETPLENTLHTDPREWSLLARHSKNGAWNWVVIGAASLYDIAVELFETLQTGNMSEIAIYPPGTPMPRMIG
ncbi:hypothetical protein ACOI1H_14705 [Loktanella sp. DJP18]|uniref:hypothetical protein n=1 Tax=Loktanella sp. DJP18 TaxID=3409788 RepID=UPI003BB5E26B